MAGSQRSAWRIQYNVSCQLIRQELKDPRLGGLVTISAVKVSDMGYAEVYVTVMGRELGASKVKQQIKKL